MPRQIVTPYKPSEDIEQTPLLLPPTPTSPDSLQTASGYFSENAIVTNNSFINPKVSCSNGGFSSSFEFTNIPISVAPDSVFNPSNPFANMDNTVRHLDGGAFNNVGIEDDNFAKNDKTKNPMFRSESTQDTTHEYHEISDDEAGDKFDLGPSLLDEMDLMFRSMNLSNRYQHDASQDIEGVNKKNELAEFTSKLHGKNG